MSFKDLYRGKCFLQKKYGLTNTNFEKLFRVFLTITMACVYDKQLKQPNNCTDICCCYLCWCTISLRRCLTPVKQFCGTSIVYH